MTLETELLRIIEQQQMQQEKALQQLQEQQTALQVQQKAINELERYNRILSERCSEQQMELQMMKEPQRLIRAIQQYESDLAEALQQRLTLLIKELNIQQQIKTIMPNMVQKEIEKQLIPLTEMVINKMDSVEQYQQKLAVLVQTLSTKL